MKLYRVVPNFFSMNDRLDTLELTHIEALYYKMGYSYFYGNMHAYNNIFSLNEEKREGKYFYSFLEDAIKEGYYLLVKYHKCRDVGTFYIVEYDFKEDIVMKHFGFGDYSSNSVQNYLMEFYVEKSDFITPECKRIKPYQISREKMCEMLFRMLCETLEEAKENSEIDAMWYSDYCRRNYLSFSEFLNDPNVVLDIIKSCYFMFPENGELIQTDSITGNILMINIPNTLEQYSSFEKASEYFSTFGRCDFSKKQEAFKRELLYFSGNNSGGEKNQEKVLQLLKNEGYM